MANDAEEVETGIDFLRAVRSQRSGLLSIYILPDRVRWPDINEGRVTLVPNEAKQLKDFLNSVDLGFDQLHTRR